MKRYAVYQVSNIHAKTDSFHLSSHQNADYKHIKNS